MENQQFAVCIVVNNESGVLTRISSLFSKRGFNIDTFTAGVTENPEYTRITITATSSSHTKEQLIKQLAKLYDVKKVELMESPDTILRELLIVKINAAGDKIKEVLDAANVFRSKVIDMSPGSLCIEITGDSSKINAFLEYLQPYGILEYCRTGAIAIGRGQECLYPFQKEELEKSLRIG